MSSATVSTHRDAGLLASIAATEVGRVEEEVSGAMNVGNVVGTHAAGPLAGLFTPAPETTAPAVQELPTPTTAPAAENPTSPPGLDHSTPDDAIPVVPPLEPVETLRHL